MSIGPNSGQQRKWRKSKDPSDLTIYQSLLSSFCAEVHNAKASYFHNKINSASDTRNLFKTFNSLLCPLLESSPLSSSRNQGLSPSIHSILFSTRYPHFCQSITYWTLTNQGSDMYIQLRLHYSQSLKPCGLQKLIPTHQSSFCWICLPILTLLTIRSSCPSSHHWISHGFHFTGLNPISLVGLSRWPGVGRYPQHINWSLGFPRDRFLDPSSSPYTLHHWLPLYTHMVSPTISILMTHSSISHFDQMIQR